MVDELGEKGSRRKELGHLDKMVKSPQYRATGNNEDRINLLVEAMELDDAAADLRDPSRGNQRVVSTMRLMGVPEQDIQAALAKREEDLKPKSGSPAGKSGLVDGDELP